jgi:hypothetical protein
VEAMREFKRIWDPATHEEKYTARGRARLL